MSWKRLFERKSLEILLAEMAGEHRLHRVLGPVSLTALGVGAIIGAGIFAITGRVAAQDAGPSIMVSFAVAGVACAFAALCYAEFAAMAPVAGSAYTYTYATLGELCAWIIGWDLILEYAMACSVVAAHWTHYLNEFLRITFGWAIPAVITSDPGTKVIIDNQEIQAYMNLPAMLIMALVTVVLVIGIRESAVTNAVLVVVKVAVVLMVIALGVGYINTENWTGIDPEARRPSDVADFLARNPQHVEKLSPGVEVTSSTNGRELLEQHPKLAANLDADLAKQVGSLPDEGKKWGMLSALGIKGWLEPLDEKFRSSFMPYGLSGIMIGASLVFFAFIGFDSISTHSEEAIKPHRDVPIGILASLVICTIFYMLVSGVITGMEPYPQIDPNAAVAVAFRKQAAIDQSPLLNALAGLIALGALAGMTSVLLVTFLSQARVFLAMARDGLLPHNIFGVIHERFRTPHRSTVLTGAIIVLVSGLLPIRKLEEMVSIGTLMAFMMVCASVLILRITRPDAHRPFRCPALFLVAPAGMFVCLSMMLFLPLDTWFRLFIWLGLGLVIYFAYGIRHSTLRKTGMYGRLPTEMKTQGMSPTDAPLE